jgi:HSP20 family protein
MSVNVSKTSGRTPDKTGGSVPAQLGKNPLLSLRDEIDQLFDSFMMAPFGRRMFELDPFRRMGSAFGMAGDVLPTVDVKETETALEITAELPGIEEKDLSVTLADGILTIKGEKNEEHEEKEADYQLNERRYGAFQRSFRLPETVDGDKIAAAYDKGVLKVTAPKTKPAKAKKIDVKTTH